MKLRAKVIIATWQWLLAMWASALAMSMHPNAMLLKFMTSAQVGDVSAIQGG
jgi:hypothetical protein